jgi:energy-converting hydrogenase Eha subunit F
LAIEQKSKVRSNIAFSKSTMIFVGAGSPTIYDKNQQFPKPAPTRPTKQMYREFLGKM